MPSPLLFPLLVPLPLFIGVSVNNWSSGGTSCRRQAAPAAAAAAAAVAAARAAAESDNNALLPELLPPLWCSEGERLVPAGATETCTTGPAEALPQLMRSFRQPPGE